MAETAAGQLSASIELTLGEIRALSLATALGGPTPPLADLRSARAKLTATRNALEARAAAANTDVRASASAESSYAERAAAEVSERGTDETADEDLAADLAAGSYWEARRAGPGV